MGMDLYKYGGYDSMSSLTLEIGRSTDASFCLLLPFLISLYPTAATQIIVNTYLLYVYSPSCLLMQGPR
jgi:hypothetical protein